MLLRRLRLGVLLCFVMLLGMAPAFAAETADPAVWGPYARLIGDTQQSMIGYRLNWHWGEPGRKLVEDWYDAYTGEHSYTTTITPGAQPGQLVLESPKMGHKIWNGSITRSPFLTPCCLSFSSFFFHSLTTGSGW
mgnify:CR=1 FL=1